MFPGKRRRCCYKRSDSEPSSQPYGRFVSGPTLQPPLHLLLDSAACLVEGAAALLHRLLFVLFHYEGRGRCRCTFTARAASRALLLPRPSLGCESSRGGALLAVAAPVWGLQAPSSMGLAGARRGSPSADEGGYSSSYSSAGGPQRMLVPLLLVPLLGLGQFILLAQMRGSEPFSSSSVRLLLRLCPMVGRSLLRRLRRGRQFPLAVASMGPLRCSSCSNLQTQNGRGGESN